jgi:serine/threonine-protein kinase
MGIKTADDLAQQAINHNLLNQSQLQTLWADLGTRNISLKDFRQAILRRDLLTFYQIETLMRGIRATFFYGDYKVLYLVGTGTFARVYRATHKDTGEQVAVKVLRRRYSEIPEEADRFYREGQMGAKLRHPNIVPIYEVYSQGLQHYLVIEFVEGRNLYEFMQVRKVLDATDATKLTLDIAKGLDYALSKGMTHRDLKMSNVLVSSVGQAKLVDFGLAGEEQKLSDDNIDENPNPRAIDYAGLERASRVRKGDLRSDIYFLGCMYYQMVCGVPPLVETRDRMIRLSTGRFRDIDPITNHAPDLSPQIVLIVNKAIQFDPAKRYQTPAEMAADLNAVLSRGVAGDVIAASEAAPLPSVAPAAAVNDGQEHSVMIVEGNVKMQDLFRKRLKEKGYRVLMTSDPQRAVERFRDDPETADAVVFSSGTIGESAVECFNAFGESDKLHAVPAVLLLDARHKGLQDQALVAAHRVVAVMPIKLGELRRMLTRIIAVKKSVA